MPLVNNLPVAQAESQITAAHLRSTVVYQTSSGVRQGLVINSNPPEGNNVAANTVVTLFVSKGTAPVAVPNVVGQQETAAESALQNAGFKVAVKNDPTSSAPLGQVTAQSPGGGTAPPGSTVTITISGGNVPVQSVVGDSQATATQILTQAGFQVNVQQGTGPAQYANGMVFSQQPASGTAAKGSTVTIYVQTGASPTGSPTAPASPSATATPTPTASGGLGLGF